MLINILIILNLIIVIIIAWLSIRSIIKINAIDKFRIYISETVLNSISDNMESMKSNIEQFKNANEFKEELIKIAEEDVNDFIFNEPDDVKELTNVDKYLNDHFIKDVINEILYYANDELQIEEFYKESINELKNTEVWIDPNRVIAPSILDKQSNTTINISRDIDSFYDEY